MPQRLEVVTPQAPPPVWAALRNEASHAAQTEPSLASLLNAMILKHEGLAAALSYQLARKLGDQELRAMSVREIAEEAYAADPAHRSAWPRPTCRPCSSATRPARAMCSRSCSSKASRRCRPTASPIGCGAQGREILALYLQSRMSELFQVDIHPAARIGKGVFIDHGTGIVIGETAVVGDDVSMLQGVTLGGTGAERGDRHPKIGNGVLLGAGAKVLGNITIGDYAKIASGAVVLKPVPPGCTAVGVPARLVNCPTCDEPARSWTTPSPTTSTTTSSDAPLAGCPGARMPLGSRPIQSFAAQGARFQRGQNET